MTDNVHTVQISAAEKGERLDRVLAQRLTAFSRSRLKALILAGATAIDKTTVRDPGHRVNAGDAITLIVPPDAPAEPKPEDIPLNIVYEDDALIVIDKPKGLVVHPAAGNLSGTLVNALIAHCGASLSGIGGVKRPGIVHRLDKDTTGLMVVAKNDRAHKALARQFADHGRSGDLEREYLAFVWGAPGPPEGHDRCSARPPSQGPRQAGRAGGRPRGDHALAAPGNLPRSRRKAGRRPPRLPAGDRAGPTRSGCISPISAIRSWAMPSMGPASRPRPPFCRKTRGNRSRPLADRRFTPIYWASNTPKPAKS